MKDWKLVVAFDVDDTLLIPNVCKQESEYEEWSPNYKNINAYKWFASQWCYMIVWSGTWPEWAKKWADEFWLNPDEIRVKWSWDDVDISIDDCVVDLATVNIKVKRLDNSISRKEWNKNKRQNMKDCKHCKWLELDHYWNNCFCINIL